MNVKNFFRKQSVKTELRVRRAVNCFENGKSNKQGGDFMTEMVIRIVISIVLFIVIVIILMKFRRKGNDHDPVDSLSMMKQRLEKGEITAEEYEEAKNRRGK